MAEKLSRLLAGLVEQEETLTNRLIEAVFLIDQAIGNLEIIRDALLKDPEAAAPGVRDKITDQVVRLEDVAGRLEELRGRLT